MKFPMLIFCAPSYCPACLSFPQAHVMARLTNVRQPGGKNLVLAFFDLYKQIPHSLVPCDEFCLDLSEEDKSHHKKQESGTFASFLWLLCQAARVTSANRASVRCTYHIPESIIELSEVAVKTPLFGLDLDHCNEVQMRCLLALLLRTKLCRSADHV